MLHNVSIIEDEIEHDASAGAFSERIVAVSMRNKKRFLTQYIMVYSIERETYTELTLQEGVERHGLQI